MWVKNGYIIRSQVQSKFIFDIVKVKFDTFVIPVGEFPNTLFIERCRQRFKIRLDGVLKTFLDAERLSSHTCLQLLKKRKVTRWEDWAICRVIEYFLSKLWKKLLDYRSSELSWIKTTPECSMHLLLFWIVFCRRHNIWRYTHTWKKNQLHMIC